MSFFLRIVPAALTAAVLTLTAAQAGVAQTADGKSADGTAQGSARAADELADVARQVNGPAGNPECVWLGRRVVALLAREDTESAFRQLELYDRFGCPGVHIQASFRCAIRNGAADLSDPQALSARVHACWLNPSAPQATAATPPVSTGSASR